MSKLMKELLDSLGYDQLELAHGHLWGAMSIIAIQKPYSEIGRAVRAAAEYAVKQRPEDGKGKQ